jgi:hypothetical protein
MIEQLHLHRDETPEPTRRKPHVRVNNNLCNRPLARDCRVKADWKFNKKRDRWWCDLPGTKYIRLRLPRDAQRRLPDAFDVAVLFLILRQARMSKSRTVKFPSQAAMLRELGLAARVRHRRRLEQALTLWSQLSIPRRRWYREAKYESQPWPLLRDPLGAASRRQDARGEARHAGAAAAGRAPAPEPAGRRGRPGLALARQVRDQGGPAAALARVRAEFRYTARRSPTPRTS